MTVGMDHPYKKLEDKKKPMNKVEKLVCFSLKKTKRINLLVYMLSG